MLGKITLASGGLGLAVLLAGGSVGDKSAPEKSLQSSAFAISADTVAADKSTSIDAANAGLPNFATVFQTNNTATENRGGNLAVSAGRVNDERRQMMISRLQTIAK